MSDSAGVVGGNSEPQPEARPDSPGPGTGLLPGDGPAESSRHPLQERVREGNQREGPEGCLSVTSEPQNRHFIEKRQKLFKRFFTLLTFFSSLERSRNQEQPFVGAFHPLCSYRVTKPLTG